jgi:uncharacterized membrane protein YcgQ (UPF0703/DUF1980 family)
MTIPGKIYSSFFLLVLILSACATPVKKIYKSPDKFQGKQVKVKGRVISSIELSDLYSFTIKDKSGKIMVVTENLLPLKNDRIRVKGTFEKNFIYKEKTIMVIKERKLKERPIQDAKKKIRKI